MSIIIMPGYVECPLCLKRMRLFQTEKGGIYACIDELCMVSIHEHDLALNKWANIKDENKPVCPKDGSRMRMFFRASDKAMKCQCPKCRAEGKMTQVMRGPASMFEDKI